MRGFPAPIGLGFGLGAIPAAPVITAVADNGDEDSITVSVTGSGTIQLYYRLKYATLWTAGQNRSGSGDIVQTELTPGQWYEVYCIATVLGLQSPPSAVWAVLVGLAANTTIETALFDILYGNATVESLVGTGIYPMYIPQGAALPAITYQQISGPRDEVMAGPTGLVVRSSYQFNCWAVTYAEAEQLSEAVRKALDGYTGTVSGREIQSVIFNNEMDIPAIQPEAEELRRYAKGLDFTIGYKELLA